MSRHPREERKVVTVLFADLVGFTARAESLDPEDVAAVLRPYHERLRTELERWGGTVEKFIGDAVVAVFGAPVAREDDPERAVRAALGIRDWATDAGEIEVRIAVNTGEALVSLDVRPETGEGFVTGDVVNTASRLQSAAPVNGILVGEQTQRATRHVIDYRPADAIVAKGKSEAVPVWEAVQARSRFGVDVRQHGGAPLVGRMRELEALTATLARVEQQREPQLVTLVGVPGIGKSRLVWELFGAVSRGDKLVYWRQGRSLPYGEGVSFWAVAEMVKAHAGILEDDEIDVAAEKLDRAVRDVVDRDADWVTARLGPLVGQPELESGPSSRDESFTAWRTFFEALAERRPLVLVFEDIHWADEGLLDFIDHLADWSGGVPLLVLCTARPELFGRRPGWAGGKLNALTLALSPLSNEDSATLLSLVLARTVLAAETQQTLLERASGNPLYAEQFARLYAERGSVDDLPLPEGVHGLIAARLDSLPAEEKALLQDAAVMGKVFWSGALAADGAVVEQLHSLERKEFIRRERRSSVAGEGEFAFRHVLVRDVAYGQIPRAERAAKHVRAAGWIEGLGRPQDHAELLAGHYLAALELDRSGELVSGEVRERAVRALADAGERASALNNFEGAAAYVRAALDLAGESWPGRPRLLFQLGRAEASTAGEGRGALLEAAEAFEAAGEVELAAEARVLLALGGYLIGREDDLEEQLERATALVAAVPPSRAKATVWSSRARHAYLAGHYQAARELGQEALEMAESVGADEIRAEALLYLGGAKLELGDPSGIDDMHESVAVAKSINSALLITRACNNLSIALRLDGDVPGSIAVSNEGLAVAERFGMQATVQFARGARPFQQYEFGEWDEALRDAEAVLAEVEAGSHAGNENSSRFARGLIRLGRDDVAGALADTEAALETARSMMANLPKYPAYGIRAYALAATGDLEGARDATLALAAFRQEASDRLAFGGDAHTVWTWEQIGLLDEMIRVFGTGRRTPWLEAAEAVAAGSWVRAAEIYEQRGSALSVAFAGLQTGRDADVRAALDFYRSAGATRYVREAEAQLAAIA
jgi:class 3 adenylate cyclase/tetratricopeptide (TPR) repeat protein